MTWLNLIGIPFLIRFCLVVLFPFSALDKILDWKGALVQAKSSFLPGGAVLLVLGMAVEIVTPVMIVFGWHDRIAAFLLAGRKPGPFALLGFLEEFRAGRRFDAARVPDGAVTPGTHRHASFVVRALRHDAAAHPAPNGA